MKSAEEIFNDWVNIRSIASHEIASNILMAMESYAQQFKDEISDLKTKHSEELSNYNSYAASDIESRWQNAIDRVVEDFENQSQLVKIIDPTDTVATMIFASAIKSLKAITID